MEKTKLLLITCMILLALPMASAQLSGKQNQPFDIKIWCFDASNNVCSTSTTCEITVLNPVDNTAIINNQSMSATSSYFNYTLNQQNTSAIGEYFAIATCYDSIANITAHSSFMFIITQTGTSSLTTPNAIILGALLLLAALLIYFVVTLNDTPIKMLLMFISLFLILISTNFMQLMLADTQLIKNIQPVYFIVFWSIILIMLYFLIRFIIEVVKSIKLKESIRQEGG